MSYLCAKQLIVMETKTIIFSPDDMTASVRKVVEITDTPIQASNGRPLIKRVEKILMPSGRYRYPVTYIDMTPGLVDATEFWAHEKRAPGYKLDFGQ